MLQSAPTPIHVVGQQFSGLTTTDDVIFFERQGCSTTIRWTYGPFHVEIMDVWTLKEVILKIDRYPKRAVTGNARQEVCLHFPTREQAVECMLRYLNANDFHPTISPHTLSHFTTAIYECQLNDVIVSPVYDNAGSASVVSVARGEAIVTFDGPDDTHPTINDALAPEELRNVAQTALGSWIHDCDRKNGSEYVRRRIAWLTGAYLLTETDATRACLMLQRDMETPVGQTAKSLQGFFQIPQPRK